MYENMDKNAIREAILANYGGSVSKIEGSFAADMAAAASVEMAKIYATIDYAMQTFLLQTNEGEYLELRAAEYGISRKAGTKAAVSITVTGVDGTNIPAGTRMLTTDGLMFVTDEEATIAEGETAIPATAEKAGAQYNVAAGKIAYLFTNIEGVSSITNNVAAVGGSDDESDEALRNRILMRLQMPATSGNAYHYRLWAMEVDGVGAAKVLPLWNGAGTVKVVLASPDMGAVSAEIITAAQSHIEECRPIGADVTVVSAAAKNINVSATVEISADATLDAIKKEFEAAVSEYLQGIAFELSSVSYNKIGYLLLAIPGVNDYSGLKVNNDTSAVTLQTNEVPTLGTVTLSAKSDK